MKDSNFNNRNQQENHADDAVLHDLYRRNFEPQNSQTSYNYSIPNYYSIMQQFPITSSIPFPSVTQVNNISNNPRVAPRKSWSLYDDKQLLDLVKHFKQYSQGRDDIPWQTVAQLTTSGFSASECSERWLFLNAGWDEMNKRANDIANLKKVYSQSMNTNKISQDACSKVAHTKRVHSDEDEDDSDGDRNELANSVQFKEKKPKSLNLKVNDVQMKEVNAEDITNQVQYRSWTPEEDKKLLAILSNCQNTNRQFTVKNSASVRYDWHYVSAEMGGERSSLQCRNRYNTVLLPRIQGTKNGSWSAEEDEILVEQVLDFHKKNCPMVPLDMDYGNIPLGVSWGAIAKLLGNRTAAQCRNRWKHALQPKMLGIKTGGWSSSEDDTLVQAVSQYSGQGKNGGINWTKVAKLVPGRSPKHCVNRWNNHLKDKYLIAKDKEQSDKAPN